MLPSVSLFAPLALLTALLSPVAALPQEASRPGGSATLQHKVVYDFNNTNYWLENIAVRSNGNLLVTLIQPTPDLYEIPPKTPSNTRLVQRFPGVTALLGITEVAQDEFAIIGGNASFTTGPVPGTFKIFVYSFKTKKITNTVNLPDAVFLNGLSTFSVSPPVVLAGDAALGQVYKVNLNTKVSTIAAKDASMDPVPGGQLVLGVNGVRYVAPYLWYTNSNQNSLSRVKLTSAGVATGAYELVASVQLPDDFTVDKKGEAWIAGNPLNTLFRRKPGQSAAVAVLGGPTESVFTSPTSAIFGRTNQDSNVLYVPDGAGKVTAVYC